MPDGTGTGLGRFPAAGAVTGLSLVVEGALSFEDSAVFRITEAIGSAGALATGCHGKFGFAVAGFVTGGA
jgi:hypothetical protein